MKESLSVGEIGMHFDHKCMGVFWSLVFSLYSCM